MTLNFDPDKDLSIFDSFFKKRPEISHSSLKRDLEIYYLPFLQKLIDLKNKRNDATLVIGVSAIQGVGKTTQGEIMDILLTHLGNLSLHLSIDDFYITHQELNELRQKDPRYIRRGVTHDIPLAINTLASLGDMKDGMEVKIPIYDKGVEDGDGDRVGWKTVNKRYNFIFFDGWMLGARRVLDESIFESGLPALDSQEYIHFAKDINKKLDEYIPLWEKIEFLNVLYVPDYQISLKWRDQAEDALREKGEGMSHEEIKEFVHYFWRSVHPGIHIKNLAHDLKNTHQVVIINDDHSVREVLTPDEVREKYL